MPRDQQKHCKGGYLGTILFGIAITGLMGCQDTTAGNERLKAVEKVPEVNIDRGAIADQVKKLGIPVGADLYMIPAGIDDEGCETFNPFSEKNLVKTAIHYRQADGSFGIARDPAICKVDMVAMESEEDGPDRYRAVPVNADLPPLDVEIVYYKTSDGSYSANKPKDA